MRFEFTKYGKTPRMFGGDVIITEKLDGSNGCILIHHDGTWEAGSRNRLLDGTSDGDNFGFYKWVEENIEALAPALGAGVHHGEWVGQGIQSNPYDLDRRIFALFNTDKAGAITEDAHDAGLWVVPELYRGELKDDTVAYVMTELKEQGSFFADVNYTEGCIVFNKQLRQPFKVTWARDGERYSAGKWEDNDADV